MNRGSESQQRSKDDNKKENFMPQKRVRVCIWNPPRDNHGLSNQLRLVNQTSMWFLDLTTFWWMIRIQGQTIGVYWLDSLVRMGLGSFLCTFFPSMAIVYWSRTKHDGVSWLIPKKTNPNKQSIEVCGYWTIVRLESPLS